MGFNPIIQGKKCEIPRELGVGFNLNMGFFNPDEYGNMEYNMAFIMFMNGWQSQDGNLLRKLKKAHSVSV